MRSTQRTSRIFPVLVGLFLAFSLIWLVTRKNELFLGWTPAPEQSPGPGQAQYATPYNFSIVPFTDFRNSKGKAGAEFWKSLKASYDCPPQLKSRVGKPTGDGGKWMCGLDTLGRRSLEEGYNCTVYSFGVNRDSSFEAEVLLTTQCFLFAYDPTVEKIGEPLKSSNPRVTFQKLGIAGKDTGDRRTLKTLMEENGHKFVDILKVDVEGAEYASLEKMLDDFEELPFGQLLLELHNLEWTPERVGRITGLLESMEERGARVFSVEPNFRYLDYCAEFSLINLKYLELFVPDQISVS